MRYFTGVGARPRERLREWKEKRATLRKERIEWLAKEVDFLKDFRELTSLFFVNQDRAKTLKIMRLQRLLKLAVGHE